LRIECVSWKTDRYEKSFSHNAANAPARRQPGGLERRIALRQLVSVSLAGPANRVHTMKTKGQILSAVVLVLFALCTLPARNIAAAQSSSDPQELQGFLDSGLK
jgi:hypothetical protein